MMFDRRNRGQGAGGAWARGAWALLLTAVIGVVGCGTDETSTTTETPCSFDDECEIGQVCLAEGVCGKVDCQFCGPSQICWTSPEGESSCSRPECNSDDECAGDASCDGGKCVVSSCESRDDCPEGKICNVLAGTCVDPPDMCATDFDCPDGQVCDPNTSECRDGCSDSGACDEGEFCNPDVKRCEPGCDSDDACGAEQSCDTENNQCACDPAKCAEGFVCDAATNGCVEQEEPETCEDVDCPEGQMCDPGTLECIETPEGCTTQQGMPNSCPPGSVCNEATGECTTSTCPDKSPEDCTGATPYLSMDFCECVQCLDDTNCDMAAGESCNFNGQCQAACANPCDQADADPCAGVPDTNYCFGGCCVECVGAADCAAGEACVDGFCDMPPPCDPADPTTCPSGYTCTGGQCQPMQAGGNCDVNDPMSCPQGQFCQPASMGSSMGTCQGLGGGMGCGLCNPNCTCDGNLTCDGFACTGCMGFIDPSCPGMLGVCLEGLCIGF